MGNPPRTLFSCIFDKRFTKLTKPFRKETTDRLLADIRDGIEMSRMEKLNLLFMLSIPSIMAQISMVLMFFIDASMVGHLGAGPSASVGLVESTTWLLHGLCSAVSLGFSVQVAHRIGAKDMSGARNVARHALTSALVISTIISLIGMLCAFRLPIWLGGEPSIISDAGWYFFIWVLIMPMFQLENVAGALLKSSGDMRIPSITNVAMCVLDVIFNYFFIFILGLGVVGAAIGTALSITISALVMLYFCFFRSPILSLKLDKQPFRWDWRYIRKALAISTPMALQSCFMSGAQIVSTIIVAPLGAIAIATNSLAVTAESLCYMPDYGFADAATTLVGQSLGAKRRNLAWAFAKLTVGVSMGVMVLMGVIMWIFAPEMMGLLSPVAEIRELGTEVLRIEAWAEPMFAASIVCYYCMIGAGDTLKPALLNLASMWGVRLTLAAIIAPIYGLVGVWVAMALELTTRGSLFLARLFFGKWMKDV